LRERANAAPVASKHEAEKVWEPKFIAEIVSGKDPRVAPERKSAPDRAATVADLLKLYRTRYVDVEPLKSRGGMASQLNVLLAHFGQLPVKTLERPDAIEDFKEQYAVIAPIRPVRSQRVRRDRRIRTETAGRTLPQFGIAQSVPVPAIHALSIPSSNADVQ
jgi:hypothetical protein